MNRLLNKCVIVAGAGSSGPGWGNGKASAVLFAREGATVIAVDRNLPAAQETKQIIDSEGGRCLAIEGDVTDLDSCSAVVEAGLQACGGIDVLMNNVGILRRGGPVELSRKDWDQSVDINMTSFFLMCKAAIPAMLATGGGSIVNTGSVAGVRYLGVDYISYSSTKAAILGFTRSLALQYASCGIRANTVLPGLMDTPMIVEPLGEAYENVEQMRAKRNAQCPMGFMGDAWDVAHAALFLSSDEAKYITGTELIVDGGLTARC